LYPRCDSLFRNLGVCHPADLCHSPRSIMNRSECCPGANPLKELGAMDQRAFPRRLTLYRQSVPGR
jgi:hypothetical protein